MFRGEGEKDSSDGSPSASSLASVPAEGKIDGESPPLPSADGRGEGGGEGCQDGAGGVSTPAPAEAEAAATLLEFRIEMDLGLATRYVVMVNVTGKIAGGSRVSYYKEG